jgi:hypothetical protein
LEALKRREAWPHVFEAVDGKTIAALAVLPNVTRERVLEALKNLSAALQSVPSLKSAAGDTAETDPIYAIGVAPGATSGIWLAMTTGGPASWKPASLPGSDVHSGRAIESGIVIRNAYVL